VVFPLAPADHSASSFQLPESYPAVVRVATTGHGVSIAQTQPRMDAANLSVQRFLPIRVASAQPNMDAAGTSQRQLSHWYKGNY